MKRFFYLIIVAVLLFGMCTELHSNYIVSDYSDLPDENVWDEIYYPHTLRSAIQNANYKKVAASITLAKDFAKIYLESDLPGITAPVFLNGKGLTLEPLDGALVYYGLSIFANNVHLTQLTIQNFEFAGIRWKGNDGIIENVTSIYNGEGLYMSYSDRNRIGSDKPSSYASNYFYGSKTGNGINMFRSHDNIIEYCAIGHKSDGEAVPNGYDGIYLGNSYRTIIRNNVISGNDSVGIYINGSYYYNHTLTLIEKNIIGLNGSKGKAIPNQKSGIFLQSTKGDTIRNNIISGNKETGIYISDEFCTNITVEDNIIGTDKTTKNAIPNSDGIRVEGTNHKINWNIISGNSHTGLIVSTNSEIMNNIIGLDSSQTVAVPNYTGVRIQADDVSFGNHNWDYANVIAGNLGSGIEIVGDGTERVWIFNNIIGTNSDFSKMIPNGGSGIKMAHSLRDIDIDNNIIASSELHGIEIMRNHLKPNNINVYNNLIGWSPNETDTARIGGSGIYMFSVDSIDIYQNTITGTDFSGIYLGNDSSRNVNIYSNNIGYSSNNELQRIKGSGIYIEEANDVNIGRDNKNDNNLIQNCDSSGVYLDRADSVLVTNNIMHSLGLDGITIIGDSAKQHIRLTRNTIGPEDDEEEKKIQRNGIFVKRGYDIEIGDIVADDAHNVISHCKEYGIFITDSSSDVYSHANRFRNNTLGGIALDTVISWYFENGNFNDSLDADVGSNGLQNTLDAKIAKAEGDSIRLKANFRGIPETIYGVEVSLTKEVPDIIKFRVQGDTFIERFNIITDSEGNAEIDKTIKSSKIAANSAEFPFVTALVFGAEGTSCFSHLSYVSPVFRDVKVVIDTLKSSYDEYGIITIESVITNVGNTIETNIEIRDTTSGVVLLDADISLGTTDITDNIFSGNIPIMNPGDSVRFTTKSKAQSLGDHKRYHHIYTYSPDMNLINNIDTILFNILPVAHNIALKFGWNLISTNVEPVNTSIPVVWGKVKENILMVKNNAGATYIPAYSIDNIKNWNISEGYHVYASKKDTLVIKGFKVMPGSSPIQLNAGWNTISYLRNSGLDCETAFASITDNGNVLMVKDNYGNSYIPAYNINTIGNLVNGQGYKIYVLSPDELIYPAD